MSSTAAQQYLLLAKTARGSTAVDLTTRILEHEEIFGFDEFLRLETFLNTLKQDHPLVFATLELFAYGTFNDYHSNRSRFIPLSPVARRKLQLLTIASLAARARVLPYDLLLKQLQIESVRELEDLIIDGIYAQVIRGKLDQLNHRLYIEYAIARDVNAQALQQMEEVLDKWCQNCSTLMNSLKYQAKKANEEKKRKALEQEKYEKEMLSMTKAVELQGQQSLGPNRQEEHQYLDLKQVGGKKTVRPTAKRIIHS